MDVLAFHHEQGQRGKVIRANRAAPGTSNNVNGSVLTNAINTDGPSFDIVYCRDQLGAACSVVRCANNSIVLCIGGQQHT